MSNLAGRLGKLLLRISPDEASVDRRGFTVPDQVMRQRLERIGATFIFGYHSAFEEPSLQRLTGMLDSVDPEWRGFAYEGAAMALMLLDYFTLGSGDRIGRFLRGPGDAHRYMVHVGAGWALARMPVRARAAIQPLDPLLRWLAIDGIGFHEGYFHWSKYANGQTTRKRPRGYGARAFDQGLGRSLWFVEGGDVDRISARTLLFPQSRREDLWSGVGLACAYAGGASISQLERLRTAAGHYISAVAQGTAFAAKARQEAGNPAAHTETACRALCGTSADDAAAITDLALRDIDKTPDGPRYETWRRRIATILAQQEALRI